MADEQQEPQIEVHRVPAKLAESLRSLQPVSATSELRTDFMLPEVLTFTVARAIAEQNADWSEPVRLRFEPQDDGTVVLWLQTVSKP